MHQRLSLQQIFNFYDHSLQISHTSHGVYSGKTPTPPKSPSVTSSTALGREQGLDGSTPWVFQQPLHHQWGFTHQCSSSHCTINGASLCQPQPFKSYFLAGGVKHEAIAFLLNDKRAQSEGRWPLYSFKQLNLSQPEQSSTFTSEPESAATLACIMYWKAFFIMFTSMFLPNEITEGQIWFSNQF